MRPQIILFGDSLTEWSFEEETCGFGWALQSYYAPRVEICNEGKAGYAKSFSSAAAKQETGRDLNLFF
jgi:isoamyl acetate esterase